MHATDEGRERRVAQGLSLVFLVIVVLACADLVADSEAATSVGHMVSEGVVVLAGLVGFVGMARRVVLLGASRRQLADQARNLQSDLAHSRQEAERWRREAKDVIDGLGAAIDRQLDHWGLSPAEKEVAILLLKGLSHKDLAEVRGVSEATVRQQARSMYRKAGLGGRADLAAFFLEDLLAPVPTAKRSGAESAP